MNKFKRGLAICFASVLLALSLTGCQSKVGNYTGDASVDVCINEDCDFVADGQSDEREIASAIASVLSAGGGQVNIRPGQYDIAGTMNISLSGKSLVIQGGGNATIFTNSMSRSISDAIIFNVSDTATTTLNSITFRDLRFAGDSDSGQAIKTSLVYKVTADNCRFSGFSDATPYGSAIFTASTTVVSSLNNIFTGNTNNLKINDSMTEAVISAPGKYTEWNGTNFTTITFAAGSTTIAIATSTACCQ